MHALCGLYLHALLLVHNLLLHARFFGKCEYVTSIVFAGVYVYIKINYLDKVFIFEDEGIVHFDHLCKLEK